MLPISDPTMRAIEYALEGLSLRSQVIADNVANSEVRGFRPQRVDFEESLQRAMRSGDLSSLRRPGAEAAGGVVTAEGIGVSVEDEVIEMMKTNLTQDAMVGAYNFKIGLLRSAVSGR